ncbi:MAG: ComEC/Rec2 family competence protein [Helicobacteraceae bacterium]|nr:ComEC/Rec2 family competence protein [Helicobacteraceae bacterium]
MNYLDFNKFDDKILQAEVLSQYLKTKKSKEYYVLKLKAENSVTFYTTASKHIRDLQSRTIRVQIFLPNLTFREYLRGFYTRSNILNVYPAKTFKSKVAQKIISQHKNIELQSIFSALFLATPIQNYTRQKLSSLGVSHLLAISGFHLTLLGGILFFLLKFPYQFFQNRYLPYRNISLDLFLMVAILLFTYVAFLDYTPSLLRSFAMLIVGFILYDRGYKVISIQTLLLTILLLLALFPLLVFSIGFWLSVAGVFYIFLFLKQYENMNKYLMFFTLPTFVYFSMLPISLFLFSIFSHTQIFSILYTIGFTIFYPLELLLHILNIGGALDSFVIHLLNSSSELYRVSINNYFIYFYILISALAIRYKYFFYILTLLSLATFVFSYTKLSLI